MWKCVNQEYIVSNKWIKVRKDKILLPDGVELDDYYVIENNDVALVLAITQNSKILLKKEYRYPINEVLLELPGGTFEPHDDSALETAKRELLEETGYIAKTWKKIGQFYDYPTKNTCKLHIFLAEDIEKVSNQNVDVSEYIEYYLFDLSEVEELIMKGEIKVSASVASILMGMKLINSGYEKPVELNPI